MQDGVIQTGAPRRRVAATGLLVFAMAACSRKEQAAPKAPPPPPSAAIIPVVPTPTVQIPANMGLTGEVGPAVQKSLTASVPLTPTAVTESRADRERALSPPTPVPTVAPGGRSSSPGRSNGSGPT